MQFSQSQIDETRTSLARRIGKPPKLIDVFWKLQHGRCALCGCQMDREHPNTPGYRSVDHIIPTSRGGSNDATNKRLAHRDCNSERGNQLDEEMSSSKARTEQLVRQFLSRTPKTPNNNARNRDTISAWSRHATASALLDNLTLPNDIGYSLTR